MPDIVSLLAAYPLLFNLTIFIVGLTVGSFLNVVVYRLPVMMERSWKQELKHYFSDAITPDPNEAPQEKVFNLAKPDSRCPKCGHKIRAWENIPIISWLCLRGKCSQCQTPISIRYPSVELLTGVLSLVVATHFGFSWQCLAALIFTWMLIAMTFIDLDKTLLPDQLTLPLMWLGLLVSIPAWFVGSQDALIGAMVGYLSLWSLYWAFKLLTGKEGMGYGDFKLLAALGAWVGWQYLPVVILLSSLAGAIIGIAHLSFQGKDKSNPIPFGPYLAIAGWITLLAGQKIADCYWQWVLGA